MASAPAVINEFPPFRLDTINQCLWRTEHPADERMILTPKAFDILRYLVENAGRLVTHDEFLNTLWPETRVQPEVLKSHISEIRVTRHSRAQRSSSSQIHWPSTNRFAPGSWRRRR